MVFSHLLRSRNAYVVNGAPEDRVVTAAYPSTTGTSIALDQGTETRPLDEKAIANDDAKPITVEGIELPGQRVVDGVNLIRNGHGLRSITYFGIGIRIYVAAMYSEKPILSAEQAMGTVLHQNHGKCSNTIDASLATAPDYISNSGGFEGNGPLQLDFTFLRYVRKSQVVSAWTQQLDHSVTHRDYDGYQADRDRFIQFASEGPIENHGIQSIQIVGEETRIIDQGKLKGIIRGRDFQRSFLSMWFGSKAVSEDLKSNLLWGEEHHPAEIRQVQTELQEESQQVLVEA